MKAIMMDHESRRQMIKETAAKHEKMFTEKFIDQMFSNLDSANELDGEEGSNSGIFGGKFGSMLVKPALVSVMSEQFSGNFGLARYIAESMCKKEGLTYEPSTSITA